MIHLLVDPSIDLLCEYPCVRCHETPCLRGKVKLSSPLRASWKGWDMNWTMKDRNQEKRFKPKKKIGKKF